MLGADPTRIDVAYHGVDHSLFHRPDPEQVSQVSDRLGLHGKPYVAFLGAPGAAEERPRTDQRLGRCGGGPGRAARAGAGRRGRLERGGGRGGRRRAPRTCAWCRPGYLRFTRLLPGFLGGALVVRLPEPGRGIRAARAGGHGVRRAGAHHALHVAAGGRRGRGGLHRAGRRAASRRRCAACSTIRSAGSPWAWPGTPGRRSSPGPPRPRPTWPATPRCRKRRRAAERRVASAAMTPGHSPAGTDPARQRL